MTQIESTTHCVEAIAPSSRTFLDFPLATDLSALNADIAILGIPFGLPYSADGLANDQSRAPDALRRFPIDADIAYTRQHYDFDLGGTLLDDRDIRVVDCGNVRGDRADPRQHYANAEAAARAIFERRATLISLGGDHGVPIPVLRALEVFGREITLVQIDAHLDWREDINGEREGYSSPMRRASEMPWIANIVQIGLRGIGSARAPEVNDARAYGATLLDAYTVHERGIPWVLEQIPDDKPIYLTVDADGLDPSIMPGVIAQTPGGLNWVQIRQLVHGLVNKNRLLGMDLVEIAPSRDVGDATLIHAERLLCNVIGACVRANYYR